MKLLKKLTILTLLLIFSWFLYEKLSNEPQRQLCIKENLTDSTLINFTIYENYSWTKLWNKYDGEVTLDNLGRNRLLYKKSGNKLNLFDMKNHTLQGEYSLLNTNLIINKKDMKFIGKCSVCKDFCLNNIMH